MPGFPLLQKGITASPFGREMPLSKGRPFFHHISLADILLLFRPVWRPFHLSSDRDSKEHQPGHPRGVKQSASSNFYPEDAHATLKSPCEMLETKRSLEFVLVPSPHTQKTALGDSLIYFITPHSPPATLNEHWLDSRALTSPV